MKSQSQITIYALNDVVTQNTAPTKAYIIHPKNLSIREDGIICILVYMTFCL